MNGGVAGKEGGAVAPDAGGCVGGDDEIGVPGSRIGGRSRKERDKGLWEGREVSTSYSRGLELSSIWRGRFLP